MDELYIFALSTFPNGGKRTNTFSTTLIRHLYGTMHIYSQILLFSRDLPFTVPCPSFTYQNANLPTLFTTMSSRWLMYITKCNPPNIYPCSSPLVTSLQSEKNPPQLPFESFLWINFESNWLNSPSIPFDLTFQTNLFVGSCQRPYYSPYRSFPPPSSVLVTSSKSSIRFERHDFPCTKPSWLFLISQCLSKSW